ncbi:MAG: UDP-glucose 4-epimerase GalE [Clostridiales bacterium]|nr:UDP-glucose 4-epimerase GalE [Clostridiales bacterium]
MIVVVGGAGYVGGAVVEGLLQAEREVCVIDDFSTGHPEALKVLSADIPIYRGDMADTELIQQVAESHEVEVVMHFAALALVGESMEQPARYWEQNFIKSKHMFDAWLEHGVDQFIFSSTAATYGEPKTIPITEAHPTEPVNPYGHSKRAVEWYLEDLHETHGVQSVALRYFNAAGAGDRVGEDHTPETHLIPLILETAAGERDHLEIYGTDYETRDGTCLRDFVHVKDLFRGHLAALEKLDELGCEQLNLGTETGNTVREVIETARDVTGREISASEADRRPGDPARLVASNKKAREMLNWQPRHDLEQIIADAWRWKQNHPQGY